jgi:FtsX-like permease family protein
MTMRALREWIHRVWRRLARLHAGGLPQAMDALRDQRGVPLISGLSQDVRLAIRSFNAARLLTSVAVLSIGIRVALGATPKAIMRLALTRIAMMIGVGLAAGVAMSMWAAPLVAGLLFDLSPREPTVPVAAAIVLLATAGLASWMPVRRAARASASTLLREP